MADDLLGFRQSKLLAKAKYPWELKIGCNTPPVRTKHGWLTLYHAVGYDKFYRLGAMLLDLDDPSKVIHRTKGWIFQPEEEYEKNGSHLYISANGSGLSELLEYLLACPS